MKHQKSTRETTSSQSTRRLSRRSFFKTSAVAAGAAVAGPLIVPSSVLGLNGATPPSERICTGHIGLGHQASGHLLGGAWTHLSGGYVAREEVQVLAVCDLYQAKRDDRCAKVNEAYAARFGKGKYKSCVSYVDFRELLARQDIDAVVVALPMHSHAFVAMKTMEAGKDVYCEKPIAPTIQQGRTLVETARRTGRVYQGGTQQRSEYSNKFRFVCEMVRSGRIGQLKEVYGYRPGGLFDWPAGLGAPKPVPEGFDWDLFLLWVQWFPYDGNPGTGRFQVGDINWTPHHYDFIQWVLDADRTGPVEMWIEEGQPAFRYASGVVLYGRPYPGERIGEVGGACFVGTKGRIAVDRENIAAYPSNILADRPGPNEVQLYRSNSHAGNFLECVRTRQRPICDVETAHRANTLVLLGGIVAKLKRRLLWDPKAERFTNDDEANRLLAVAARAPWHI